MRIEAVFFDLGETLINEGEIYGAWADWIGVPRHTFNAVLGSVISHGESHLAVFEHFRPGFDLATEEMRREEAGQPNTWGELDLYPDARACLSALGAQGLRVGLAGNQPKEAAERVATLGLAADVVGISELWGVEKPSPGFFERVVAEAGCPRENVLYVGDRIDNDVRPGLAFGVQVAFLRRGPWGNLQRDDEAVARCTFRLDDLTALPDLVAAHNAGARPGPG
jgi:HAD superfamily hydrolase (TIGR01549 family)